MLDPSQLNRTDHHWTVSLIVVPILFIFSALAVFLRLSTIIADAREARCVRNPHNSNRSFLWNDRILFLGYLFALVFTVLNIYLDIAKRPAPPEDINDSKVGKMNFATHIGWLTAIWLISSSVLLYYDCVFDEVIDKNPKRRYKWERKLLYSTHLLVFLWWLSCFLFVMFEHGTNIAVYWTLRPDKIYEIRIWWTNITHIVLSIYILVMPIPWIKRSQRTRFGQSVYFLLFLAGALTIAVSILRLKFLKKRFGASAESRYELSILAVMFSIVELHLAIICTILPRLGYTTFIAWIRQNQHERESGSVRQGRTIGNFKLPNFNGEGVPLKIEPTHDVESDNRRSDQRTYEEREYDGRQYHNLPHNDMKYNNRNHEDIADHHRPFRPRTIE